MYKRIVLCFSVIFNINCTGKTQYENYPEFIFRNNEDLVSTKIEFSSYNISLIKTFNPINQKSFDLIKNKVDIDTLSFFKKNLILGFTDSSKTSFMISLISQKNIINSLDQGFIKYLNGFSDEVKKTHYMVNGIKIVQYQIINPGYINLKLFIIDSSEENYLLDFIVPQGYFNKYIESIEASLSTLKKG
tara:strand:+ start:608 stop:1174 length:567 start_codon:yes stop_codon:yes gene_type:complete